MPGNEPNQGSSQNNQGFQNKPAQPAPFPENKGKDAPPPNLPVEESSNRPVPAFPNPQNIAPRPTPSVTSFSPITPTPLSNTKPVGEFRSALAEAKKGEIFEQLQKITAPSAPKIVPTPPPPSFQEKQTSKGPLFKTFSEDITEKLGKTWDAKKEKGEPQKPPVFTKPLPQKNVFPIPARFEHELPKQPLPQEKRSGSSIKLGPILGIILVVLLLIVAGLYSLGKKVSERTEQEQKATDTILPNPAIFGTIPPL